MRHSTPRGDEIIGTQARKLLIERRQVLANSIPYQTDHRRDRGGFEQLKLIAELIHNLIKHARLRRAAYVHVLRESATVRIHVTFARRARSVIIRLAIIAEWLSRLRLGARIIAAYAAESEAVVSFVRLSGAARSRSNAPPSGDRSG